MDFSQFKEIFIGEAQDLLARAEQSLVRLEQNPQDKETMQNLFRAIHTLKGNAATMDLHLSLFLTLLQPDGAFLLQMRS